MRAAANTELFGERITDARDTDLGTRNAQMRVLVQELGVTRAQAKALIRAYEQDVADCKRIGNDTARSDADFIAFVMSSLPCDATRTHRVSMSGRNFLMAQRAS